MQSTTVGLLYVYCHVYCLKVGQSATWAWIDSSGMDGSAATKLLYQVDHPGAVKLFLGSARGVLGVLHSG